MIILSGSTFFFYSVELQFFGVEVFGQLLDCGFKDWVFRVKLDPRLAELVPEQINFSIFL